MEGRRTELCEADSIFWEEGGSGDGASEPIMLLAEGIQYVLQLSPFSSWVPPQFRYLMIAGHAMEFGIVANFVMKVFWIH